MTAAKKALTRQDQRNLERIIHGDFQTALSHIHDAASDWYNTKVAEIEAKYAALDGKAPAVQEEIAKLDARIKKLWTDKAEQLMKRGFEPVPNSYNRRPWPTLDLPQQWQGAGKAEELAKARQEMQEGIARADRALRRAQEDALRGVFIAGIAGTDALELLSTIPSAQEAFAASIAPVVEITAGD